MSTKKLIPLISTNHSALLSKLESHVEPSDKTTLDEIGQLVDYYATQCISLRNQILLDYDSANTQETPKSLLEKRFVPNIVYDALIQTVITANLAQNIEEMPFVVTRSPDDIQEIITYIKANRDHVSSILNGLGVCLEENNSYSAHDEIICILKRKPYFELELDESTNGKILLHVRVHYYADFLDQSIYKAIKCINGQTIRLEFRKETSELISPEKDFKLGSRIESGSHQMLCFSCVY